MPQITNLTQLLDLVRSSAASSIGNTQSTKRSKKRDPKSRSEKLSRTELKRVLGNRLQALEEEKGSPDERQMLQLFVETLLVWEFGEDILTGANAHHISERICSQLMANTPLRQQIARVLQTLRR